MDRLRRVLGRLGGILGRLRMVLESSWAVLGRLVGVLGPLVGILERLVDVLGPLGKKVLCHGRATRVPVAGTQGPPIRILYDFPDHYKDI